MTIIVHGGAPSPFARKVRVSLFEKGLEHESRMLAPIPKTPELLAMNPLGKIPILEHGDLMVPDSSVILAYLEKIQPEPAMYPAEPKELARALFVEEYADTRLAEAVSPVFFQRFVRKHLFQQEPDEALVQQALAEGLPPVFDWLESQLTDGATTFFSRFGVADIGVGVHLQSLAMTGESVDGGRWPRLARYAQAVTSRPSFEKAAS